MFKKSLPLLAAGALATSLLMSHGAAAHGLPLLSAIQDLDAKLDTLVVPFSARTAVGGLCNAAAESNSNPDIVIDSDGLDGTFVVTSVLIMSAFPGVPETGLVNFSINWLQIDGDRFDTRTENIMGPTGDAGIWDSADIMGTPLQRSGESGEPALPGANFPHQIVAESAGADDIVIEFFCRSDDEDYSIESVLIAGWKRPNDTVTVTYVPDP